MNREYFEKLIEVRDVIGELYELMQDVAKEAPNPVCFAKAKALVDIISDFDDLVATYGSIVVVTSGRESSMGAKISPVEIAKAGIEYAKKNGHDMVIIDTAGRLHIDEALMEELVKIKASVNPTEILLTVDAMTGQDAVNVAKTFNDLLDITGVVLTKMDGDTRGGAALSVKYITGKPIKFIGMGEKMDAIELFHPDRMASRILGMGDILSLIEKAEAAYDEKNAKELEKKMREQTFSLEDFLDQMRQLKKMGNLDQLLGMMPGVNAGALKNAQVDEKQMARIEAIILSMTPEERLKPDIINGSRRRRIAKGCGLGVEDVNRLLKQFDQMKKMMKQLSGKGARKMLGRRMGGFR